MNILVCIKQVPDSSEIKIDPEKNVLIRDGVPSILNPFDGYALEAAARIRDLDPGTRITVMSMGPEQAKNALRECLAAAADKAFLISGRAFAGSDTLATSYILSAAIRRLEASEGPFDAVFCGKQAIDGDTAQVGPEIAAHLGIPQVTCALEAEAGPDALRVTKETENGTEILSVRTPCLITFTKPKWNLRYPTIPRKLAADRAEIPVLSEIDLPELDSGKIGLSGSPTRVRKTFVPQKRKDVVLLREETVEESARELYRALHDAELL